MSSKDGVVLRLLYDELSIEFEQARHIENVEVNYFKDGVAPTLYKRGMTSEFVSCDAPGTSDYCNYIHVLLGSLKDALGLTTWAETNRKQAEMLTKGHYLQYETADSISDVIQKLEQLNVNVIQTGPKQLMISLLPGQQSVSSQSSMAGTRSLWFLPTALAVCGLLAFFFLEKLNSKQTRLGSKLGYFGTPNFVIPLLISSLVVFVSCVIAGDIAIASFAASRINIFWLGTLVALPALVLLSFSIGVRLCHIVLGGVIAVSILAVGWFSDAAFMMLDVVIFLSFLLGIAQHKVTISRSG